MMLSEKVCGILSETLYGRVITYGQISILNLIVEWYEQQSKDA